MLEPCVMCERVAALSSAPARLVHEFEHSILWVGDHQRFPGYCVLISKTHAREPFELPSPAREGVMRELLLAAEAVQAAFQPWKINYGCYGNQVAHVHWHLFPRYETDARLREVPWTQATEFGASPTTDGKAREVAKKLCGLLLSPAP
jgi:diadenosine tetraphosphate (Ap4A) HIT family hydrolase